MATLPRQGEDVLHQEAMHWLEKAFQERSGWMLHLKVDPRLDPLRSDPRFQGLLRRVGLE